MSTERQASSGSSLSNQTERIKQYCELNEMELTVIFTDVISGKRADNRAGLTDAVKLAKDTGAALIVYSLSRLSRSTRDTLQIAETLTAAGADLISIKEKIDTTTAAGKMVFRMLAVLNEFEREQISERVTTGIQHRKKKLQVYGREPYGFVKKSGRLVPVEAEQKTIRSIFALRARGLSLRNIAGTLNKTSTQTKRDGGRWFASTVSYMLNNDIYAGNTGIKTTAKG